MFKLAQASPVQSLIAAFIFVFLGVILVTLLKSPNKKYLIRLFLSAFFIRVIALYVVYYYLVGVGGDGFLFTDDRTYDAAGREIAALLRNNIGFDALPWFQNPGYFYFNGWLYSILGSDTFTARMFNVFLSSLTVVLLFEITRLLFGFKQARIAGLLAAFMPNMVFWSVSQFKDIALIFVMVYIMYLLVEKKDKRITVLSILALMSSLFVMWFLRKDLTLPYIGIVMLWLLLRYTGMEAWIEKTRQRGLSGIAGVILIIFGSGVLIGLANTEAGNLFVERIDKVSASNQEFLDKANSAQIGFTRHLRINSVSDIYKLPFSMGFVAIAPLPSLALLTSADRAGLALYSVANLIFILLLPFVVLGFVLSRGLSSVNSLLLRWFPISILAGVSIVYMGVLRYKEQLMPFFLIWAAVALYQKKKYKGVLVSFYLIGFVCVIIAVVLALSNR